ncbi:hypothetical protein GQ42DRAFT_153950 [Ramicandelaber brevisporus]|nr:hypothetical protein GQ42DRAFT_153950 [Ramicandelaber brevisporus]
MFTSNSVSIVAPAMIVTSICYIFDLLPPGDSYYPPTHMYPPNPSATPTHTLFEPVSDMLSPASSTNVHSTISQLLGLSALFSRYSVESTARIVFALFYGWLVWYLYGQLGTAHSTHTAAQASTLEELAVEHAKRELTFNQLISERVERACTRSEVDMLRSQLSSKCAQYDSLNRLYGQLRAQQVTTRTEMNHYRDKYITKCAQLESLRKTHADTVSEFNAMGDAVIELHAKLDKLEKKCDSVCADRDLVKAQLVDEKAKCSSVYDELVSTRSTLSKLQHQHKLAKLELDSMECHNVYTAAEYSALNLRYWRKSNEVDELNKQLGNVRSQHAITLEEVGDLRAQLSASNAERDYLRNQNGTIRKTFIETHLELHILRLQHACTNNVLATARSELNSIRGDTYLELHILRLQHACTNDVLAAARSELNSIRGDVDTLQRMHQTKCDELLSTREKLDHVHREYTFANAEIGELNEELGGVRDELGGVRDELADTAELLQLTREQLNILHGQYSYKCDVLESTASELATARDECVDLYKQLCDYSEKYESAIRTTEELRREFDNLRQQPT